MAESIAADHALSASAHADSLTAYILAGQHRANTLGNRGPVRFNEQGQLHPEILEAYWQHGF